jgi:hypothetical protein
MKSALGEYVNDTATILREHRIPHAVFLYSSEFTIATTYCNGLPMNFMACIKLYSELFKEEWDKDHVSELMEVVDQTMMFDTAVGDTNKSFNTEMEFEIFAKEKVDVLFDKLKNDTTDELTGFMVYATTGKNVDEDHCGLHVAYVNKVISIEKVQDNPLEIIKGLLSFHTELREADEVPKENFKEQLKRCIISYGILNSKIDLPIF